MWIGRVATRVISTESKDRFHDRHDVEATWIPAVLWEKKEIVDALARLFNEATVHSGKLVHTHGGKAAYIHVQLNVEDENTKVLPPSATPVKVQWWNKAQDAAMGRECSGYVVDQPTDSDFVILIRLWERGSRTQWMHFTLKARVDTVPLDRMKTAISKVVSRHPVELPADDECGSFDLMKTVLAHGPEADPHFGEMIRIMHLVPAEERDHLRSLAYRVQDVFKLDASQAAPFEALIKGFVAGVMLIQGPPGTGKTRVNACIAITVAVIGRKVLIASGSNNGVSALMMYIVDCLEQTEWIRMAVGKVVRFRTMGTTARELSGQQADADLRSIALFAGDKSTSGKRDEAKLNPYALSTHLEEYAVECANVDGRWKILSTLGKRMRTGTGRIRPKDHNQFAEICEWGASQIMADRRVRIVGSILSNCAAEPFRSYRADLLLLDEAAQTLEPDVYIALLSEPRVVILTGDHKQLGPTVISLQSGRNPHARQLAKPMYTRLLNAGYKVHMLKTNYRMHPHISQWPNKEYYDGQLLNAPNTFAQTPMSDLFEEFCRSPQGAHGILGPLEGQRRIFIDVASSSERSSGSTSWHNKTHLNLIDTLVKQLLDFTPRNPKAKKRLTGNDIVIVTPYRAQRGMFVSSFIAESSYANPDLVDVKVATVDGYQGLEAEIVIVDLTAKQSDRPGEIGFVGHSPRLNVALTRAKVAAIAVGNLELWQSWIPTMIGNGTNGKAPAFGRWLQDVIDVRSHVKWPTSLVPLIAFASGQGNAPPPPQGSRSA